MSWDELVASALVGTARRPPAIPTAATPGSALAALLSGIDRDDPEAAVLQAGAAVGLYRQAGWRPLVDGAPLPPASPADDRLPVSEAAALRLDAMVAGRFRPVLPEWLALVAAAGRRVPADRLRALLDVASANPGLRAATVAVAGERGRWLGGLNPSWAWAAAGEGVDDRATWATAPPPTRRLLLGRLRAADPAAARELLASTWATETPDDRAAFVATLTAGLSMDDEPFLEAALDDRRKEVRQAAAALLWRLPDSRLAARMAGRARPLVRLTGSAARKQVEATFSDDVDAAMARDGIVAKPPAGQGERAWRLHQLVAATPLRTWPASLRRPPARLVELADPALRRAWAAAAVNQGDEAWAAALLDAGVDLEEPALLGAVAHDRAVAVATDRVGRLGLTPAVLDLLDHCPPPWGRPLSLAVVERLDAVVKQRRRDADGLAVRARLGDLGARLDPTVAPAAAAAVAEHAEWWSDVVGWFVDLLTFRVEMAEELGP